MKTPESQRWAVLALAIALAAVVSFLIRSRLRQQESGSSFSKTGENSLSEKPRSASAFDEDRREESLGQADSKTDRPRRILSKIELEIAEKELVKIRERYQPLHPISLKAENKISELQERVQSTEE